jgi:hypothetical protein
LPELRLHPPAQEPDAFLDRVRFRLAELADDLKLPVSPRVIVATEDASGTLVHLGDQPIRVPYNLTRNVPPDPLQNANDHAERVAAAVIRARWRLLSPHLGKAAATLFDAAALGLDLEDLRALQPLVRNPERLGWAAAARCPSRCELLISSVAPASGKVNWPEISRAAAQAAGIPVPQIRVVTDPGLEPHQFRLRLRRVRLPVERWQDAAIRAREVERAIVCYAAALLDAEAVAWLLLDSVDVALELTRRLLQEYGAPAVAAVLRELLDDGITIPHPAVLRRVQIAALADPGAPGARALALPGTLILPPGGAAAATLAERFRAALVGPALLRRAGWSEGKLSVWVLPAEVAAAIDPDALALAALSCARADAVLLAPDGLARHVRRLIADALPTLLVVEPREWPATLGMRHRGTLALPRLTGTRTEEQHS